jgi:LPS export ABC transporter protein LptC
MIFSVFFFVTACSFDYGITEPGDSPYPDITMEDLDYVRIRKGTPIARMQAEIAERYEKRRRMELKNYSFEQYNTTNEEIDATGSGGFASVELETSNIHMSDGIEIIVDTEDITLETERLDWDDGKKFLKGGDNDPISVEQSDGTNLNGTGFSADVRARTWFISYDASGDFIHNEDEDETVENDAGEVEITAESGDNDNTDTPIVIQ